MSPESANPKYIAVIAVAAGLVLLVGALLKPESRAPEPVVTQTDLARLQRLGQRRTLDDISRYVSDTAASTAAHIVRLNGAESSGLIWNRGGYIVSGVFKRRFPDSLELITPAGTRMEAGAVIASPELPIAVLQARANASLRPITLTALENLAAGDWILAVARRPDGSAVSVPGWYGGTVSAVCGEFPYERVLTNLPLTAALLGGGVFDLDGDLIGIVIRCGEDYTAMSVGGIESAWRQGTLLENRLVTRYGIRLELLDEASRAYFQSERGVLVTEVWKGYAGMAAGFAPGDVILAVDENPVEKLEDMEILLAPPAPTVFTIVVKRGRRNVDLELPSEDQVAPDAPPEPSSGLVLEDGTPGIRIDAVEPKSPAGRAGVQPGDHVLRIGPANGRTPNLQDLQRALSAEREEPVFLVLDRPGKQRGVFLP